MTAYDFDGFKEKHFTDLAEGCDQLRRYYDNLPLGEALSREQILELVALAEKVMAFDPLLPNAGGGRPKVKDMKALVSKFKTQFQDKKADTLSFWMAQDIAHYAFSIHNYMSAVCECTGPQVSFKKRK